MKTCLNEFAGWGCVVCLVLGWSVLALPSVAQATTLQYDDGTYELSGALHGEAVRFSVPSTGRPYRIDSVTVFVEQYTPTGNQSIDIKVWNDNGGQLASAIGTLIHEHPGTVASLQWYTFDISAANIRIPVDGTFFAGWTSDDWLADRRDNTTIQDRTWTDYFGSGFVGPDSFAGPDWNALVRVDVSPIIPEPLTMLAVGLGISGLGGYIRKRRRC